MRGTVRSVSNEAKVAPLKKAFGEYFNQLELVEADLLDEESLTKAIAGSTYVVHTASPFLFNKPDEEIIKPAVDGTLAVMRACRTHKVKRCVVTSSVASVVGMADADKPDLDTGFYDESCWSNPDRPQGMSAYPKSKTLAEKAAWDFQRDLPEAERFEIVTVNPCFVQGPSLIAGGFTSAGYIEKFFNGSFSDGITTSNVGVVDVRNVAKMHLEAVRRPEAAN